jgi:predicted nucleotidyltransferase
MLDALREALDAEPAVAYAVLFGSSARRTGHAGSDTDVAVELRPDAARDPQTLGRLLARLEAVTGRPVDLVLLDEAPSPLAYRIFRDGHLLLERDHAALVTRKTRAILDYLDFKPIEEACAAGVLRAAARGR